MKFGNSFKAIPLALALTFIHPSISMAQEKVSYNIQDIIEREIGDASIIDLNEAIFLKGKNSMINEGEYIYVLYQTNTIDGKDVGVLIPDVYTKDNMKDYQTFLYPSSDGSMIKMLLAKKGDKMGGADFVVYEIKK